MQINEGGSYEILLKGHLEPRWADWFDGLSLTHLAAAVRTPSVSYPAPDLDVERWRPQDTAHHRVLSPDASPEDAIAAAGELIAEPASGSPARR